MGLSVVNNGLRNIVLKPVTDSVSVGDASPDTFGDQVARLCAIKRGSPYQVKYPAALFSYILEGEIHAVDEANPGEVIKLRGGDILSIEKGTAVTFTTPSAATSFHVTLH